MVLGWRGQGLKGWGQQASVVQSAYKAEQHTKITRQHRETLKDKLFNGCEAQLL